MGSASEAVMQGSAPVTGGAVGVVVEVRAVAGLA